MIDRQKHITLKGFTIPELLVSLAISAILVLAAFYAFRLFSFQSTAIRGNSSVIFDYEEMKTNLKTEFANAQLVKRDFEILSFTFENSKKEYWFLDSLIIVSYDQFTKPDTFRINAKPEAAFFKNRYTDVGIIDRYELIFYPFDRPENLIFTKKYSATDFMNFEKRYEN